MTVITYFSHDVSDTAVARRIRMLRLGGAEINLLGFRRSAAPIPVLEGVPVIDLGQSFGGRLGKRCLQLAGALMKSGAWLDFVANSDIVMARNLEMATLANVVRRRARSKARLVYECLDIHGTQLSSNPAAKLLRGWEKSILARSSNLIISSSSHLTNYFSRLGINLPDVMLVENKRVVTNVSRPPLQNAERHPPWRIGWFGLLRCAKSLEILSDLARRYPDLVDITIRGRPTYAVEPLLAQHLSANLRFEGPYTEADLPAMYGACDFVWAVEYAGQNATNARWALGNRLYEGTFYNVPVIALADTAMGAWLEDRFIGIRLSDDCAELLPFLSALTPAKHQALRQASANLATTDLVCTVDECQRIVDRLAGNSEPVLVAA